MLRGISLLVLGFLSGCGGSEPFDYVPVSGSIAYEDGTPIPLTGARLQFFPLNAPQVDGAHPRPALAMLNANGEFEAATSHRYGDGLIPGKHKVVIMAEAMQGGKLLFPKACLNDADTPLVVDTAELPLVIKVPKP